MLESKIVKSTRHQKIIGDFGEQIVCNWLSRSGYEVARVDHTGIDIIAYNPKAKNRIGITVKSRTRYKGTEKDSVNLFKRKKGDEDKLKKACSAFNCEPWIAIYVETKNYADLFLTPLIHYNRKYRVRNRVLDDWKMNNKHLDIYSKDKNIKHIRMNFTVYNW